MAKSTPPSEPNDGVSVNTSDPAADAKAAVTKALAGKTGDDAGKTKTKPKLEDRDDTPVKESDTDVFARLVELANKNRTNPQFVNVPTRDFCWLTAKVAKLKLDKDQLVVAKPLIDSGTHHAKMADPKGRNKLTVKASDLWWIVKLAVDNDIVK